MISDYMLLVCTEKLFQMLCLGQDVPKEGTKTNPTAGLFDGIKLGSGEKEETSREKSERLSEAMTQFQEGQKMAALAVKYDSTQKYGNRPSSLPLFFPFLSFPSLPLLYFSCTVEDSHLTSIRL